MAGQVARGALNKNADGSPKIARRELNGIPVYEPLSCRLAKRSDSKSGFCYDWRSYLVKVKVGEKIIFGPINDFKTYEVGGRHFQESLTVNAIRQATQWRRIKHKERYRTGLFGQEDGCYLLITRVA
jgi:hypothetical protein